MVFSSHLFLFGFLPLALALYYAAPARHRNLLLTLLSYVFYGWTNPAYVALLLLSTAIDWYAGRVQGADRWWPFARPAAALAPRGPRSRTQRSALVLSVLSNLSLLGFFKYFHFGLDSWNTLAAALGAPGAAVTTTLKVVLPLGISFYTFQSMSYSIDVWRGRAAPMASFVDFACFVSMFPQLVAGPIIRFSEVADQLARRELSLVRFTRGVAFLSIGLAKKVLLANPCGKIADTVFDAASSSVLDAWYGLSAYAFQIYFDFSGYSDMAIGLGLMLGFFKYFNFGLESWNGLVRAAGLEGAAIETALRVTLPLGISFYTFQSMSYSIDVYRGRVRAIRSFVDFACFVSMFPQLVAGPIVRFAEVADQLRNRSHTLAKFARGAAFLTVGLAKKVLLANPCARVADAVFDAGSASVLDAWQGLVAYAFQIYFDFSGYSDMAIGLGLMLGFVFPKNFDSPYRATSMTDFWRRWHISLSTWLRDYLYIPLGGNRRGPGRTYVNLAITMLLGGLWHGAAWNFVAWGAYHGALLALERRVGEERLYSWLPRPLRIAVVFVLVLFSWVLFRAADLTSALDYFARLLGLAPVLPPAALLPALVRSPYLVATLVLAAVVTWGAPQTWTWTRSLGTTRLATAGGLLLLVLAMLATQDYNPFIYFIF